MFGRRILSIFILYCCLFTNVSSCFFIETLSKNMHTKELDNNMGKPVYSFVERLNGLMVDQWYYTTELSRILLVGEPQFFESVRYSPISFVSIAGPFFDNRFEDFIVNVKQYSLSELQEAIKDAILLTPYSTKAYSVKKLLDYLIAVLQHKIAVVENQIKHNFKWDQESLCYMKKSIAWLAVLATIAVATNTYNQGDDAKIKGMMPNPNNDKQIKGEVSNLEFVHSVAVLGCIPASLAALKGSYKVLTIDPKACNPYLEQYKELLTFVKNLKSQLEANGCITFQLDNGRIATIKQELIAFGITEDILIFDEQN